MNDKEFLTVIADRLVALGDDCGMDFVLRLRKIAAGSGTDGSVAPVGAGERTDTTMKALLRMVTAFGSGVQAADAAQAGALAEAYACIEAALLPEPEVADLPIEFNEASRNSILRDYIELNRGSRIRATMLDGSTSEGTIESNNELWFWFVEQHDAVPFRGVDYVDRIAEQTARWPSEDVKLVDYVHMNCGNRVRVTLMTGSTITGTMRGTDGVIMSFLIETTSGRTHVTAFCDVDRIDPVTSLAEWSTKQGCLALVEFLAGHVGSLVLFESKGSGQVSGYVGYHDSGNRRQWFVETRNGVEDIDTGTIFYAKELEATNA